MKTKTIVTAMLLMFCAVSIFAQLATNVPPADNPVVFEENDHAVRAFLTKYSIVKFAIFPLVTILVMGIRKVVVLIPDQIWPYVTPLLGALFDFVGARAGFWADNPAVGVAMGGLATWFHQIGAQTREVKRTGFTYSRSSKPGDEVEK